MSLPEDVRLRNLGLADLDSVLDLVERCDQTYLGWAPEGWTPPDLDLDRARWEESWGPSDRWSRGVVDRSGRLVGVVSWRPARDADGRQVPGVAHVSALFVEPRRWREGIAAELLELAEGAMRDRGYGLAELWTPEGAPARRFYEAVGWVRNGRRSWHEPLHLTVIGYQKRLTGHD